MGLWKNNRFFKNLPPILLPLPRQCHISHFTKSQTIHWLKHYNFFCNVFQTKSQNKKSSFWFIRQWRKEVKTLTIVRKLLNFVCEMWKSHVNSSRHAPSAAVEVEVSLICCHFGPIKTCKKHNVKAKQWAKVFTERQKLILNSKLIFVLPQVFWIWMKIHQKVKKRPMFVE